eukprot:CAMPEP_0203758230 /NCGR_PEP_ID=MMETSP0098-20131031/10989_1 /ASSEMBLY_ACC=CAM_ASM_000208 /TAXON_ID=96639 /ORGANISM=" , Strain NY0313808BC1" /LENGTH=1117 /DNA_ID=CAMNT_0050650533 /DNA_START=114 /DNA_END=3467 /DNA_ORIENTATION=-
MNVARVRRLQRGGQSGCNVKRWIFFVLMVVILAWLGFNVFIWKQYGSYTANNGAIGGLQAYGIGHKVKPREKEVVLREDPRREHFPDNEIIPRRGGVRGSDNEAIQEDIKRDSVSSIDESKDDVNKQVVSVKDPGSTSDKQENLSPNTKEEEDVNKQVQGVKETRPVEQQRSSVPPKTVVHNIVPSPGKMFISTGGYVVDGGLDLSVTNNTDYLVIIGVGIGEFGESGRGIANIPKDEPLYIPKKMECVYSPEDGGGEIRLPARLHINGTAFQHKFSPTGRHLFPYEKLIWMSCVLGKRAGSKLLPKSLEMGHKAGHVRFEEVDVTTKWAFNSGPISTRWYIATEQAETYNLVECSAPIHHMTGVKWLIEWIEYRRAFGFDHIHLYFSDIVDAVKEVLEPYLQEGFVTFHDWTGVPEYPRLKGVHITNWEHGQRAARNDCYFWNRGVSKYIAFSDIDEVWALAREDSLVQASESFYEDKFQAQIKAIHSGATRLTGWFEQQHAAVNALIGFVFKSVTVPPVPSKSFLWEDGYLYDHRWFRNTLEDDFGLFLGAIQIAESECQYPYNCGLFHSGRQKYMLRTAHGSLNINFPLFYHALNEDYENTALPFMEQVPRPLGYIRHYAGHFKHTRIGGMPLSKRKHCPLPRGLLKRVRERIDNSTRLKASYESSPAENLLKLDNFADLSRFSKDTDDLKRAKKKLQEDTDMLSQALEKRHKALMTFDRYTGRLNNQLLTYDWAFRLSRAFKRTLVLTQPRKREFWIGLPQTKDEERHNTSLWDLTLMRKNFDFLMWYDTDTDSLKDPSKIDPDCVWTDASKEKNKTHKSLASWMSDAVKNPACSERIHFATSNGLVHPYRTDTTKYGVDHLVFWRAMQPSAYLKDLIQEFIDKNNDKGATLGFHSRSHNSYGPEQKEKAKKSCQRLAKKPLAASSNYKKARELCCKPASMTEPDSSMSWPDYTVHLGTIFQDRRLEEMCDIQTDDMKYAISFARSVTGVDTKIFLATDHENPAVDKLAVELGGSIYEYDGSEVKKNNPSIMKYPNEGNYKADWYENIQGVLLDMLMLSQTDVFFGNPGSTLSQVVCMWRMVSAKDRLERELSNTCGLVLLAQGAYTCDMIAC